MENAKHRSLTQTQTLDEFFKVFMPDTSSTHLRLPKAFTKFFKGITPMKATLVDNVGNSWKIGLEKIKDGLVLTNGWKQFVADKCLEEADFLVFEYDGNSATFFVKIFSRSGIKKEDATSGGKHVPILILDEDPAPQSCRKMQQRGLKRKHSPTTLKINEKSISEGARGMSKRAYEANGNDYEKKIPGIAKRVTLKNPDFVIPYSRWRTARMEIPKSVLRKLNVKLTSKISLRDENGKLWPVTIITTKKWGRIFLADGWSDFRNAKNIQQGQICAFKFVIRNHNNVAQELLVSVSAPSK